MSHSRTLDQTVLYYSTHVTKKHSRAQAAVCAAHFCRREGIALPSAAMEATPAGKPFFSCRPPLDFSISHSGKYWLCAFSHQPIGVDIEQKKEVQHHAIAARFYSPEEQGYVAARGQEGFFDIWVAKESYTKLLGLGLSMPFSSFSTVEGGALRQELAGCRLTSFFLADGYASCLCSKEETVMSFICIDEYPLEEVL